MGQYRRQTNVVGDTSNAQYSVVVVYRPSLQKNKSGSSAFARWVLQRCCFELRTLTSFWRMASRINSAIVSSVSNLAVSRRRNRFSSHFRRYAFIRMNRSDDGGAPSISQLLRCVGDCQSQTIMKIRVCGSPRHNSL